MPHTAFNAVGMFLISTMSKSPCHEQEAPQHCNLGKCLHRRRISANNCRDDGDDEGRGSRGVTSAIIAPKKRMHLVLSPPKEFCLAVASPQGGSSFEHILPFWNEASVAQPLA